jgi:hypothetical protein
MHAGHQNVAKLMTRHAQHYEQATDQNRDNLGEHKGSRKMLKWHCSGRPAIFLPSSRSNWAIQAFSKANRGFLFFPSLRWMRILQTLVVSPGW